MLTRRHVLKNLGAGAAAAATPGISFARAESDARLVIVILRGAMDGLAMLPPYGDGQYRRVRGQLALPAPAETRGVLKLDGLFGLHPAFEYVHSLYQASQAVLLHAVASPYRERSHFDGQDVLENGVASAGGRRDGWLNRAIAPLGGKLGSEVAIALAQNTPLILRGPNSTTSWAPSRLPAAEDDTLDRIANLYADDQFFSERLTQARESQAVAGDLAEMDERRRRGEAEKIKAVMQQAGRFLASDDGPRIAVVESGGWDTHANQGSESGQLANKFAALDAGIDTLRDELGDTWTRSVVAVVTEFGRTAAVNGTRGTDHGTASSAMLLGGAVQGGRIVTDWPGLAAKDLFQGRDLQPTTDLRALFKAILQVHFGLSEALVETDVFPNSGNAPMLENLIRA